MNDESKKVVEAQPETEDRPVLRGKIVTGMPLSADAGERITRRFEELTGARVSFTSQLDKKQIAGIRVELNGYSYDETVRGQLLQLQKLLKAQDDVRLAEDQPSRGKEEP